MGRGRAKAKQTKVARELKYNTPQTDFDRLQRELAGGPASYPPVAETVEEEDGRDEPVNRWADDEDQLSR